MKYRKKDLTVETFDAFQYDGDFIFQTGKPYVPAWAIDSLREGALHFKDAGELYLKTNKGDIHISVDDYIVQDVFGRISSFSPDAFDAAYERNDPQDSRSVESSPVAHGKWEPIHFEGGCLDGVNVERCSSCGWDRIIGSAEDLHYKTTYNFCPNCGAKMDGVVDDE